MIYLTKTDMSTHHAITMQYTSAQAAMDTDNERNRLDTQRKETPLFEKGGLVREGVGICIYIPRQIFLTIFGLLCSKRVFFK